MISECCGASLSANKNHDEPPHRPLYGGDPTLGCGRSSSRAGVFSSAAAYSSSFTSDHAGLIWQDGQIVFENGNVTQDYGVASISKSLTGLVLGKLMDEGRFGPSSFLHQYLPTDWVGSDSRKRSIKLWHADDNLTGEVRP